MKRMRYDPQVKTAILAAVQDARKSGKTWAIALESAQKAGYRGNLDGLSQFVRSSTTKTSTPKTSAAVASAPKKTKVKKAKTKAKPAVAAPAIKSPVVKSSSNLDITALVHKAVTDAVVQALEGLLLSIKSGK